MSDQHGQQQNQHRINSVSCYRCGLQHTIEGQGDPVSDSILHGWSQRNGKIVCQSCRVPRHQFDVPYTILDERLPPSERGTFLDQRNQDGTITTWKLVLGTQPTWTQHRTEDCYL